MTLPREKVAMTLSGRKVLITGAKGYGGTAQR